MMDSWILVRKNQGKKDEIQLLFNKIKTEKLQYFFCVNKQKIANLNKKFQIKILFLEENFCKIFVKFCLFFDIEEVLSKRKIFVLKWNIRKCSTLQVTRTWSWCSPSWNQSGLFVKNHFFLWFRASRESCRTFPVHSNTRLASANGQSSSNIRSPLMMMTRAKGTRSRVSNRWLTEFESASNFLFCVGQTTYSPQLITNTFQGNFFGGNWLGPWTLQKPKSFVLLRFVNVRELGFQSQSQSIRWKWKAKVDQKLIF